MSGVEAAIGFGASVLGIAGAGISVATTLIRFSVSYKGSAQKIEDLSSRVSLTATILTTVGNTINSHHDYFKEDNFREKFGRVVERCKNDYEILGAAVQKAKGEVEKTESERWERKMTSWKKLLWALGGEEQMKDLQNSLEESKTQVLMMQSAASLIVLQIIGQRRALTEDENIDLAELKQKMGLLLMALREANLLSVIPVGSSKPPASKPSVSKKPTKQPMEDEIVTDPKPLEDEIAVWKEDEEKPDPSKREPSVGWNSNRESPQRHSEPEEEKQEPPAQIQPNLYEVWVLYHELHVTRSKIIQLLGIKLKIETNERNHHVQFAQIHAEQEGIETLISQLRAKKPKDTKQSTMLQQLNALGPELATDVSHLILDRINQTGNRKWFLELHAPWSKSQELGSVTHSLIARRIRVPPNAKHLVILSSPAEAENNILVIEDRAMPSRRRLYVDEQQVEDITRRSTPERRPEQDVQFELVRKGLKRAGAHRSSNSESFSSSQWPKEKETARRSARAEVHLSQQETETAVNDFLATFSSLYDDVPPEERGKVLESVPLVEEEEEESDESSDESIRESRSRRRRRPSRSLIND